MKALFLSFNLLGLSCSYAQLYADFTTTNGNFTVELNYTQTPATTANFVTLAEGSRAFVDSKTGAVKKGHYYNGMKVHRTETVPSFRIFQAGSPKGDGTDGPGYEIKDEIRPELTHQPYVISMAHSGPNTNGSQFFITGATALPSLDGLHTVFGSIPDEASRTVVDAIIDAGANQTVINSVAIRREGQEATAFDPLAQGLPVVEACKGNLEVKPDKKILWNVTEPFSGLPTSSVFAIHYSLNLQEWIDYGKLYRSQDNTNAVNNLYLGDATVPKLFFNMSQVNYFPAYAPNSLAGRTVVIFLSGGAVQFNFNFQGTAGMAHFTDSNDDDYFSNFTVIPNFTKINPYSVSFAVSALPSGVFGAEVPYLVKCGCDSATTEIINGRFQSSVFVGSWIQHEIGGMIISR